jgi:hypothetical protein
MRASALIIRRFLERAIDDIRDFLNHERENEKARNEASEQYKSMVANKTPPEVRGHGSPELTPTQHAAIEWKTAGGKPITDEQREKILAGVLPGQPIGDKGYASLGLALRGGWRESTRQAATWLRKGGETVAADGIECALDELDDASDAAVRSEQRNATHTAAEYLLRILSNCLPDEPTDATNTIPGQRKVLQEPVANPNEITKRDGGSVLPSSKRLNPTESVDNFDVARAREQLRPFVEIPAFREYLKKQILKWEAWHRSQVEEIRRHEIARDYDKEQLDRAISQGILDPEDKDNVYVLSYEWHKDEVTSIPENFEFKLVAEGEPVLFHPAGVAATVAMFWCDINHSGLLVPDYSMLPDFDFLEPDGLFSKLLSEQLASPIPGRYKRIHWFVEAVIKVFSITIKGDLLEQSKEQEQVEQSVSSNGLQDAALKALIDGGLAGVLAAASKVDAATKHSETMMTMLKTDTKYYEWSADDWVTYLKAAKGTIIKTRAWKHIKDWRSGNKEKRKAN